MRYASPPNRPVRRRQRFRTAIIATVAIIVLSLVAFAPTASAASSNFVVQDKRCIEVVDDYDIRTTARDSDIFVIVHEKDDVVAQEHICKKLEATLNKVYLGAAAKGKGAVFAYLVVEEPSEGKNGNKNFVKNTLGVRTFPSYLYVSKGMDRYSKFSDHVTQLKGGDSLEMSVVETFVEDNVGFRLGNDVFSIVFFDSVASRFVSYGDTAPWSSDRIKQRILQLLVRFSTIVSFKEPFSSIGKLYNRAFSMSLANGMDYSEKQVKKLQKKLDLKKHELSDEKIHEFQQKISILKSFEEPKENTAEDDKQIFIHAALHLGLAIATLLLIILPAAGEETEEEEVINAEPVVAKAVGGDYKSTKKTS
mmetsp:Transcript_81/g.188  ORF Transcript_81/g.188 Transcript_81/m.188 type:complete len:364 (+) Transcript_81:139-1230(+)